MPRAFIIVVVRGVGQMHFLMTFKTDCNLSIPIDLFQ